MFSILFLGLLIGVQHAFEADHVAAVSSIALGKKSRKQIVTQGALWGVGHTITLFLASGLVMALGTSVNDRVAGYLEFFVGIMLVGLGGQVLWRLLRDKVHFHMHSHGEQDGHRHFHAHSHRAEGPGHDETSHSHNHKDDLPIRSLFVGIMHGIAGSAAVIVLSAGTFDDPFMGLLYVALFGVGSIIGMAIFSTLIAIPIAYAAGGLTWFNRALQTSVGAGTIALGLYVMYGLQIEHNLF